MVLSGCGPLPFGRLSVSASRANAPQVPMAAAATPAVLPAAGVLANNGGSLTGTLYGPSSLIANNSAGLLSNNAAGLISNNGGGLVSNNSAGYRVQDQQYLSERVPHVRVAAFDIGGNPISEEVETNDFGLFKLENLKPSGPLVFIKAKYKVPGQVVTLVAGVPAPRKPGDTVVTVDPGTTLAGKKVAEMVRQGKVAASEVTPESVAKIAAEIGPVMSRAAVARACLQNDYMAAKTFDAMLAQSPELAARAADLVPEKVLEQTPVVAELEPPPPAVGSGSSGTPAAAPPATPTPTPTPVVPAVTSFTPTSGMPGDTVTITGTDFSTTLANNTVTFNGAAATVTAATATSLTVTLPAGATDGTVSVTVASQTGTSAASFDVIKVAGTYNVGTQPEAVAIDSSGRAWVTNTGSNNVTILNSNGTAVGTFGTNTQPDGLVIDGAGDAWIACNNGGGLFKMTAAGVSTGPFATVNKPYGVVIDGSGNFWVATENGKVTKLDSAGGSRVDYNAAGTLQGIAMDGAGNFWIADNLNNRVYKMSAAGVASGPFAVGTGPMAVAVDPSDNVWVTNNGTDTVSKLDSTGTVIATYTVGLNPYGIVSDGSGGMWVAINGADSVVHLASDGTTLLTIPVGLKPRNIALRGGALWVPNRNANTVTKILP
jgi:streptogramin lyase